nr:unnamed protein product [Callosobruchus chinensis]
MMEYDRDEGFPSNLVPKCIWNRARYACVCVRK